MSFIADIFSARTAAKGQERAADASSAASAASIAEQRRQYDLSRSDQQPWLQTGTNALSQYSNLLGLGTAAQQRAAMSGFKTTPDYQFTVDEGMRGLTARNSALGIQDSGAAQKSALRLASGLGSQQFNTYANRLSGLAGVGQTAAQTNAGLGQNYANAVTGINTNNANQLGSSYINQGNIYGNLFSNLGGQAAKAFGLPF